MGKKHELILFKIAYFFTFFSIFQHLKMAYKKNGPVGYGTVDPSGAAWRTRGVR